MNINFKYTGAGALALAVFAALPVLAAPAVSQIVVPHSVPLDFRSDRYGVTINGKPVQVFLAAMNV